MSEIEALKAKIEELKEAIEPLLPYAECDNYKLEGHFAKTPEGLKKFEKFQRETIYCDLGIFQRLAYLYRQPTP